MTMQPVAGPISSFLVISDPAAAKHVLQSTDNPKRPIYGKGLVAEVATLDPLLSFFISVFPSFLLSSDAC